MLCRYLRDYGINCFSNDKYVNPRYSFGFTTPTFTSPDVVLCFEVMEHFDDPKTELELLFSKSPKLIIASTQLYNGQSSEWRYLGETHVFFYSKKALISIATHYNYNLSIYGDQLIFYKRNIAFYFAGLLALIHNLLLFRVFKALAINAKPRGCDRDYATLLGNQK